MGRHDHGGEKRFQRRATAQFVDPGQLQRSVVEVERARMGRRQRPTGKVITLLLLRQKADRRPWACSHCSLTRLWKNDGRIPVEKILCECRTVGVGAHIRVRGSKGWGGAEVLNGHEEGRQVRVGLGRAGDGGGEGQWVVVVVVVAAVVNVGVVRVSVDGQRA